MFEAWPKNTTSKYYNISQSTLSGYVVGRTDFHSYAAQLKYNYCHPCSPCITHIWETKWNGKQRQGKHKLCIVIGLLCLFLKELWILYNWFCFIFVVEHHIWSVAQPSEPVTQWYSGKRRFKIIQTRGALLKATAVPRVVWSVMWKSWLFPRERSSFRMRCWVPMKPLQQSCAKLKLRTGLAAHAAYLKPWPRHPASVESYLAWDRFEINIWSICLSLTPLQQSGRAETPSDCGAAGSGSCEDGFSQDPNCTQHGGSWVLDQGSLWDTVTSNEIRNDHGQMTKSHGQCFFNAWSCLFSWLHHFGRTLSWFSQITRPLGEYENSMECRYKLRKSWSQMIQFLISWLAQL